MHSIILKLVKKYIILVLFLHFSGCAYVHAGKIEIKAPASAGRIVNLTGYSGMKEVFLTSLSLDSTGYGIYSGPYEGFLLMEINNSGVYPILHTGSSTLVIIDTGMSVPDFPGDFENTSFYKILLRKKQLSNQQNAIREALQFFGEKDPLHDVTLEKQRKINDSIRALNAQLQSDTTSLYAKIFQGKNLIESTWGIRTKDELNNRKTLMLAFLKKNTAALYHTDILRQIAFQYAMMNEYVAVGRENDQWVLNDIDTWIHELIGLLTPNEIANFFLNMAVGRRMIGLGIQILNRFPDYTTCETGISSAREKENHTADLTIEKWKSAETGKLLSQLGSIKILAFFSPDCPACIPSQKDLEGRFHAESLSYPVITVFCGNQSPFGMSESALPRNLGWYVDDTGHGDGLELCRSLGIEKFPAYIILGDHQEVLTTFHYAEKVAEYLKSNKIMGK